MTFIRTLKTYKCRRFREICTESERLAPREKDAEIGTQREPQRKTRKLRASRSASRKRAERKLDASREKREREIKTRTITASCSSSCGAFSYVESAQRPPWWCTWSRVVYMLHGNVVFRVS